MRPFSSRTEGWQWLSEELAAHGRRSHRVPLQEAAVAMVEAIRAVEVALSDGSQRMASLPGRIDDVLHSCMLDSELDRVMDLLHGTEPDEGGILARVQSRIQAEIDRADDV